MIRIALIALGYGFLALGVVGIIAPIMPGWIFIFVGLFVLGRYAPWARRTLTWFKRRHPRLEAVIGSAERQATRWVRLLTVRLGRMVRPARQ